MLKPVALSIIQVNLNSSELVQSKFMKPYENWVKKTSKFNILQLATRKTFKALAILQLFEQRKLDIDQAIIQYLPGLGYGLDITIRSILNHTAGIPNLIPLRWIHLMTEHSSFEREPYFAKVYSNNSKVKSKPNEKFSYSNIGISFRDNLLKKAPIKTMEISSMKI